MDTRINGKGQHCVLGHLDEAYGSAEKVVERLGLSASDLARVNNGERDYCNSELRIPGADLSGAGAKARVLNYLGARL